MLYERIAGEFEFAGNGAKLTTVLEDCLISFRSIVVNSQQAGQSLDLPQFFRNYEVSLFGVS